MMRLSYSYLIDVSRDMGVRKLPSEICFSFNGASMVQRAEAKGMDIVAKHERSKKIGEFLWSNYSQIFKFIEKLFSGKIDLPKYLS